MNTESIELEEPKNILNSLDLTQTINLSDFEHVDSQDTSTVNLELDLTEDKMTDSPDGQDMVSDTPKKYFEKFLNEIGLITDIDKKLEFGIEFMEKLKQGEDITKEEAEQLAEALHDEHPHITIDLLRRVYHHRKAQLVQFIKHILGIQVLETFPETVSNAFNEFIKSHTYLAARQLQFLELLKKYILDKGALNKRNLIESPFTMLHPEGIRGVFKPNEIEEILNLTEKLLAA